MCDVLTQLDTDIFLFLNGLGSEPFDPFWKIITKQLYWTPLFLAVFYLIQKKMGWKNVGIILLFLVVLITCTDQITNLFKTTFERLRPCNVPELKGSQVSDELFAKYADNLRQMIDNANLNQDKLTDIINKLFTHSEDPRTKKKVVRVNPELTEAGLQQVVVDTRKLVVEMYLTCEQDFEEGVNIYKAILEQRFFKRTEGEEKTLNRDVQQLNESE